MLKMPVISTDQELNERIERICERFDQYVVPVTLTDSSAALEYLKYDLPEVSIINFSDPSIDGRNIIDAIKADPWLHYGGIIGVHRRHDEEWVSKQMPNSNILSLIPRGKFVSSFSRVLRVIVQNRQILYQREFQNELFGTIAGSFVMDNDPFNVHTYANLVTNFLYNLNYVDMEEKERLHVALFEMLMNAVEHGNCDISYEEKTDWLERHGSILDLIREKCKDPEIRNRRVYLTYRITPERSYYTIADEGQGFDWRAYLTEDMQRVNLRMHGHGIRMTKHYIEKLQYNETGNEVSFEFSHGQARSNVVPEIFRNQEQTVFEEGDVVFSEGEESNYLYYIVQGRFHVYIRNEFLSDLGPEDMFLGEMSFLLNDRRSATVISQGQSELIRISKQAFVNSVQERPHYGIFLARLLAQRLSRLNARVASLTQSESLAV